MKILQIVTLIDSSNSYGGPVRVAANQAVALRAAGHEVDLVAGSRNFGVEAPSTYAGSAVMLHPARSLGARFGFAGLLSPSMLKWLWSAATAYDVVHLHLARDLVTLPAAAVALLRGVPVVVQTHGMIDSSDKALARPIDALFTRRVLRGAKAVLALTIKEQSDLQIVCPNLRNIRILPNGIPSARMERDSKHNDLSDDTLEVLYLARLHSRKRPTTFVEAAVMVAAENRNVKFRLVGPDEGELSRVKAKIDENRTVDIKWEGALAPSATQERMRRASIYVLPSVDEPFPMTVLEALALGIPCVVTDTCGLAPTIHTYNLGIVCDDTTESLAAAISSLLDPEADRSGMSERAKMVIDGEFSIDAVVRTLASVYRDSATEGKSEKR